MKTRMATLKADVRGKFIRWKKGMRVKASYLKGVGWSIERVKWKVPLVPLVNCLCAVPRSVLAFDSEAGGGGAELVTKTPRRQKGKALNRGFNQSSGDKS